MSIRPVNVANKALVELPAIAAKQPAKISTAKKIAIGTLLVTAAAATAYAFKRDAIEQRFPGSMTGLEEKVSQAQNKMTEGLDIIEATFPQFGSVRSTIADLPNRVPSKDEVHGFVNPFIEKANDFAGKTGEVLNQASDYVKSFVAQPKPEPKPCFVPTFKLKNPNATTN